MVNQKELSDLILNSLLQDFKKVYEMEGLSGDAKETLAFVMEYVQKYLDANLFAGNNLTSIN